MSAESTQVPDWKQADPAAIARALQYALKKPSGGWLVVDATRTLLSMRKPHRYWIDGREFVAWTTLDHGLTVSPAACPHMGADLCTSKVDFDGCLVCPWHGLVLPPTGRDRWVPNHLFNDGVLTWIQLDPTADGTTRTPFLPKRPSLFLDGVIRKEAACEPRDVIANRLDPWHGVHYHPYAFHDLVVTQSTDEAIDLEVSYRVLPKTRVRVGARFECPEPNTIVMTITSGEGEGSIVETHATPMSSATPGVPPRTAIVEATLASSERPGFAHATKGAVLVRPLIKLMASRLWNDDAKYAERTYELRTRG
jgi:phenylpropionate dioxygenase-like ring-hydroxylating dioxygenase large terminal subunit